jgi:hypothetical protein
MIYMLGSSSPTSVSSSSSSQPTSFSLPREVLMMFPSSFKYFNAKTIHKLATKNLADNLQECEKVFKLLALYPNEKKKIEDKLIALLKDKSHKNRPALLYAQAVLFALDGKRKQVCINLDELDKLGISYVKTVSLVLDGEKEVVRSISPSRNIFSFDKMVRETSPILMEDYRIANALVQQKRFRCLIVFLANRVPHLPTSAIAGLRNMLDGEVRRHKETSISCEDCFYYVLRGMFYISVMEYEKALENFLQVKELFYGFIFTISHYNDKIRENFALLSASSQFTPPNSSIHESATFSSSISQSISGSPAGVVTAPGSKPVLASAATQDKEPETIVHPLVALRAAPIPKEQSWPCCSVL